MKARQQKIHWILMFLSCLLAASWAQAATFNLVFFDNDRNVVGKGQFSFVERSVQICLESPGGGCAPGFPGTLITVDNPLASFTAVVNSQTFQPSNRSSWWASGSQSPGYVDSGRSGDFASNGLWRHVSSSVLGLGIFLNFNAANENSGNGSWEIRLRNLTINVDGDVLESGTFTATATPVPAAVWLFLSGLGLVARFKRKAA